ncbi:YeeE/YedE family protein [Nesterenkonia sp. MY13]|uniref:YeeE/YedE family protein n=1 Tax=Nesterenkonia sedimenti TaxID=1463632 RepID=A0A7X8TKU6_9MICC|nr:YeeE/YedE family protein [Nesterenkonia sedimenti]NLS10641.1 YeeE/YedE family protein [Nesterenkonia sedimenti]
MATHRTKIDSSVFAPAPTCVAPPVPDAAGPVQRNKISIFLLLAAGLLTLIFFFNSLSAGAEQGLYFGLLFVIGLGLGLALFHSRFGFTSAWRQLVAVGNGKGLRNHALLLGTTATIFMLLFTTGWGGFGNEPTPSSGTIGVGLFLGAFIFGIGMQLGGGCASGTLFAVGSGQSTVIPTLIGFIAGSVIYTSPLFFPLVSDLPGIEPVLLSDHFGYVGGWGVTITALLVIVAISRVIQARRNPPPTGVPPTARGLARAFRGSWPMWAGALVLALLGGAVMWVSGGIWGVTNAFALWGVKFLELFGFQPETWEFWQQENWAQMLEGSVLSHQNSLTNFGIIIGAAIAAAAGGTWAFARNINWKQAGIAVFGGILMGIGARLAEGCNIGAYLGGIASGSVSGWLWAVAALAGTWAGLKARALFGMANPKPTDSVC